MLERIFNPLKDYSLLVLRLGIGGVFLGHGYLKLTGLQRCGGFLEQTGTPLVSIMAPMVGCDRVSRRTSNSFGNRYGYSGSTADRGYGGCDADSDFCQGIGRRL